MSEPTDVPDGDWIEIANEFATVRVRKLQTRNGARLAIRSDKLDYEIHLDALELESLSWQTSETFSRMLNTPFGPKGESPS